MVGFSIFVTTTTTTTTLKDTIATINLLAGFRAKSTDREVMMLQTMFDKSVEIRMRHESAKQQQSKKNDSTTTPSLLESSSASASSASKGKGDQEQTHQDPSPENLTQQVPSSEHKTDLRASPDESKLEQNTNHVKESHEDGVSSPPLTPLTQKIEELLDEMDITEYQNIDTGPHASSGANDQGHADKDKDKGSTQ